MKIYWRIATFFDWYDITDWDLTYSSFSLRDSFASFLFASPSGIDRFFADFLRISPPGFSCAFRFRFSFFSVVYLFSWYWHFRFRHISILLHFYSRASLILSSNRMKKRQPLSSLFCILSLDRHRHFTRHVSLSLSLGLIGFSEAAFSFHSLSHFSQAFLSERERHHFSSLSSSSRETLNKWEGILYSLEWDRPPSAMAATCHRADFSSPFHITIDTYFHISWYIDFHT